MKKYILTLLIIGFVLISCKSHRFSDTHWIAVESSPIQPNSTYGSVNGLVIHFTNKNIILGDVYEKKIKDFPLEINDKQIIVNDTLWATVFVEYKDSIFLDIDEYSRIKFVTLDEAHAIKEKQDFSKHKDWILSYNDFVRELYLTDIIFSDCSDARVCLQKNISDNTMMDAFDKWNVLDINGNQLFVKTLGQIDNELYRVKNYINDSIIVLESLQYPEANVSLKKRRYLSKNELQSIITAIQNTNWKTKKIIHLDTISQSSGIWEEEIIPYESLIENKLSYRFSKKNIFQLFDSGTLVSKETWKLSPTGNEIILNNGTRSQDYIDLIQVQSNSITIGRLQEFKPSLSDEFNMFDSQEMYYIIELVKQ